MDALGPLTIISPRANARGIRDCFLRLQRHALLVWEITKQDFSDRYAGQALGAAWTFLHPMALVAVYLFLFTVVFRMKMDSAGMQVPGDFTMYILAGLVPWLTTQEVLNRASSVVPSNANLVKQVVFPIEVLPTRCVLTALITQAIFVAVMQLYAIVRFGFVPWTLLLLPALVVIQSAFLLGCSLLLAAVGAFLRDLKDIVQVLCVMNVYLMPVVYLPEWVPEIVRPAMYANPFSYQTWCFQDVMFYGRIEHPWAWGVFGGMSFLMLGIGSRVFARLRGSFGNLL